MKDMLTRRGSIAGMAVLRVLTAVGLANATSAAAAPPVAHLTAAVDYRPSGWAPASELEDSGNAPSLTNDLEEPVTGDGAQLWLGYALVGAGLLALTFGLAVGVRRPRRARARSKDSRPQLGQIAPGSEIPGAFVGGR